MVATKPSVALREILEARGIGPVAFAEMLGEDYQVIYRWLKGGGFDRNPRNQKRAALALSLPPDYFQWADEAAVAEADRKKVFQQFCTDTELGRGMSDNERASLDSHRFYGGKASISYYQTTLGVYRGNVPLDQRDEAMRINKAADDEIRAKSSPKIETSAEDDDKALSTSAKRSPKRTKRDKRPKPKQKK
jgi:hypothetical protein